MYSLKVESNWTQKVSNLALATSINLDELAGEENEKKVSRKKDELRSGNERNEDQDSTFELNYFQQNSNREVPDFVINDYIFAYD